MNQVPDHSYLSTLLECLRKFFYQYVLNLKSKEESLRLLAGTAMHKGLEVLYAGGEIGSACESVAEAYAEARPMGELEFLTVGHLETVLKNYADHWEDRDPFAVVEMIEEPVVAELDGMLVGGIPDLVVEEDGELIVLDHKTTTSNLGAHLYNRVKFSKQFPIYCLLLSKKMGQPVRRGICNAIYTGKYAANPNSKAQKFDRYSFEYSKEELEETVAWLNMVRRMIIEHKRTQRYETRVPEAAWPQHGGSHCGWCPFRILCQLPPPLRPPMMERSFVVREPTGVLLSGADQ